MSEATPRPWRTDPEVGNEAILGPDGFMVADCSIFHRKIKASRLPANAALIVTAVNAYDANQARIRELEKALERAAAELEASGFPFAAQIARASITPSMREDSK